MNLNLAGEIGCLFLIPLILDGCAITGVFFAALAFNEIKRIEGLPQLLCDFNNAAFFSTEDKIDAKPVYLYDSNIGTVNNETFTCIYPTPTKVAALMDQEFSVSVWQGKVKNVRMSCWVDLEKHECYTELPTNFIVNIVTSLCAIALLVSLVFLCMGLGWVYDLTTKKRQLHDAPNEVQPVVQETPEGPDLTTQIPSVHESNESTISI